jgi:amphi-Trp domain-containing protein
MPKTMYQDDRALTRAEVAAELRRVATDLERSGRIVFSEGEAVESVAVPESLQWTVEVKQSTASSRMQLVLEVKWRAPHPARSGEA